MKARKTIAVATTVLLACGVSLGQTHAPWPVDWNDWSAPALWVTVGNPGNAADTQHSTPGYGAVNYEYKIGKFEVTAGQYAAFLNAVAKTDPYGLYNASMDSHAYGCQITQHGTSGNYTYDFSGRPSGTEADWANRPVNFVSWGDAARFANWLTNGQGNGSTETGAYDLNGATTDIELMAVAVPSAAQRATWSSGEKPYFLLASEDEWYKAAYHDNTAGLAATYYDYPTSSDSVPGRDMTEVTNPGNNANYYSGDYLIGSPYYRTLVGEFEESQSPCGTFDQGGNVFEWNEADISGSSRGLRGGAFEYAGYTDGYDLTGAVRSYNAPTAESYNIGFRIAVVPEPASLSLLALGGLAMIMRRRRK